MFNIARKMVDAKFAKAESWEHIQRIHRKWVHDYNSQRHWAHEKREDGCHSPAQVLGWHKGTVYPESVLNRILFATRYTRHLDRHGYIRFHDWRLYGERGLTHQPVTVWVYEGTRKRGTPGRDTLQVPRGAARGSPTPQSRQHPARGRNSLPVPTAHPLRPRPG